jgi:putative ABC transport system permease protein
VGRLAWSQVRFRTRRTLALLVGMLVATTAFTVLTAAARAAQVATIGTVNAHFQPSYDILVRPAGAKSSLEKATGAVQPDFLSGIYGGITTAQWRQVEQVPGVQVAAPIAMVGYYLVNADFPVDLPASDVARSGRQLYRATTTWVSANGATRITQPPTYVYVTPDQVHKSLNSGVTTETLPDGSTVTPCPAQGPASSPFDYGQQAQAWCFSKVNDLGTSQTLTSPDLNGHPGFGVRWEFPMLVAAIDPAAEAKLDGLNHAVASGQYLPENYQVSGDEFPVLAAADSGVGEYSATQVQELASPSAPPVLDTATMRKDATAAGHAVLSLTLTASQAYQYLLTRMAANLAPQTLDESAVAYWSVGSVRYSRSGDGDLTPVAVRNPASVWSMSPGMYTPMDNGDTQYRTLREYALPVLVGTFSEGKIAAFDPLSQVPLGLYQPTTAAPANAASSKALGGSDLLPSLNLGGYVSQPAQLITTLSALPTLENGNYSGGTELAKAPISVIRVQVAGVTGANTASLNQIKAVAEQIELRTGLSVDIVAGSSPQPTTIALPADKYGTPALLLTQDWIKEGVAVTVLNAVDRSSVTLFVLILIVCALFVANSATAAVRGRRRELGILAALGWTKPRLFALVLGEVAMIGLIAGILGTLLSPLLAAALGLHASLARAALAIPVAMALAVVAGAVPAWLAARADPVACVRPPTLAVRRARQPYGITGLALLNVLRTPGRTLVGALSLAVGVAALTLLIGVTMAFRGAIGGTLLGGYVTVQVRGVDYVAVATTVTLGVLAIADALLISITERAPELATIRAFGWPERALRRMVITEGVLTGIAGSAVGAVIGLAGAAVFAGQLPPMLYAAAGTAATVGVLVTCAAALLPAHLLRRLPAAQLLAQE